MELSTYVRILRAHWLAIVVAAIVGVLVGFGWQAIQPRIYTADASGYVVARTAPDPTGQFQSGQDSGTQLLNDNLAKSKVKSYVALGTWTSVAEHAITELGLSDSPEALTGRVSVSNPLDTNILQVNARATTPEAARDLAQAWLTGMALEIQKLEGSNESTGLNLAVGETAKLPTAPSSPNARLALGIGGLAGLVLGLAYAVLRYNLDRRIRNPDGVERETGVAVVGTIPEEKSFTTDNRLIPVDGGTSMKSANAGLFAVAESMRELRTNLQFMSVDNPPRVIVVTSPLPGDGKSTTAANLAITLAASGERTILIDGDLRRPMVATVFGFPEGAGLSDVLAGRAEITDVAHVSTQSKNLLIVTSGKVPPNPSELLGSERMHSLLDMLAEQATVIIDAPPLIPVTDGAILANRADGAFVVATVGRTTFEVLKKALSNLERANATPLGIVLNRVPKKGSGATYYGYQYHGNYYRTPEEQTEQVARAVQTPSTKSPATGKADARQTIEPPATTVAETPAPARAVTTSVSSGASAPARRRDLRKPVSPR